MEELLRNLGTIGSLWHKACKKTAFHLKAKAF